MTNGGVVDAVDESPSRDAGGTNYKLVLATVSVLALLVAAGFLVVAQKSGGDGDELAHSDTQIQAIVDGYKARFPWTAPMMDAMTAEGLLKKPRSVPQMFMYFETACINDKDMLAGKPEQTRKDLSDQGIQVSADAAQRLNAAQEKMCDAMPPGAWVDQPVPTRTYPGMGTPTSPKPS